MMVVVVTGGIGSGKSVVCRILNEKYGWPVYDADARVKQLYVSHPSLLADIECALGESFRDADGVFEPKALAGRIFSDSLALAMVERLVFPCLTEDFECWKEAYSASEHVVLESATILEKPQLRGLGDVYVLVDAPVDVRCARAASRDGVGPEEIMRRMSCQKMLNAFSDGRQSAQVDYVIGNDSTPENLVAKVDDLVSKMG